MCVHSQSDVVSDSIVKWGKWDDCDVLSELWSKNGKEGTAYVEIGGNIGACVMHMLLSTSASDIRVFEPNPANLFCLTSTLLKLPSAMRLRVTLYPVALGQYQVRSAIYAQKGNMGNSAVGQFIPDQASSKALDAVPIQVKRYDDVISPQTEVSLMKIDAQGYECNILRGFGPRKVKVIKSEIANHWLLSQNCSDAGLFEQFHARNMKVYNENGVLLDKPIKMAIYDIVAV